MTYGLFYPYQPLRLRSICPTSFIQTVITLKLLTLSFNARSNETLKLLSKISFHVHFNDFLLNVVISKEISYVTRTRGLVKE